MNRLHNQNGIALVTALMFTLISLGIIMLLMTSIIQGTKTTAASKAYRNSLEASFGAVDLIAKNLMPKLYQGATTADLITDLSSIGFAVPSGACFAQKMANPSTLWTSCAAENLTLTPTESPDMTFTLKATSDQVGFTVFTKIVDTRCGGDTSLGQPCSNSDASGVDYLDAGGGVTSSAGTVTPQHRPAYYRIEVQGQRATNPLEKSQLSVLYAY